MQMRKIVLPKKLIALLFLLLLIDVSIQYTIDHNQIDTSYQGFAVDSQGNLYLGVPSRIVVVDTNGVELYSFSTISTRGYAYTINEEDQILLRSIAYLYTMDLHGNVLKEEAATARNDHILPLTSSMRSFRDSAGNIYQMKSRFFRTGIYKYVDGKASLVYQMPLLNYVLKLVLHAISLCYVILMLAIVWKIWIGNANGKIVRQ